jgi:hypothetical protein
MIKPGKDTYLIINIFLAGIIVMIFIYSGIFSAEKNNYPVVCIHEKLTGQPCISCGLSHSFSLIIRGRPDEAYQWNIYGIRIFLFFFAQLVMRITFSIVYLRFERFRRHVVISDSVISGIMVITAFMPFLRWMIHWIE